MSRILDELVAKGVSGEVIVEVAKLIADAEITARTRESAKERMRRVRERSRTFANVQNRSEQPTAHIEERKKVSKEVSISVRASRARPKTPLPDDWHPVIATEDAAEFQRFTNYAKANAKTYADWNAAWQNWKTSPYRNKGGNGGGSLPRPGSKEYRQEENWHVMEALRNYRDEPSPADDQGGNDGPDSAIFGPLSIVKSA